MQEFSLIQPFTSKTISIRVPFARAVQLLGEVDNNPNLFYIYSEGIHGQPFLTLYTIEQGQSPIIWQTPLSLNCCLYKIGEGQFLEQNIDTKKLTFINPLLGKKETDDENKYKPFQDIFFFKNSQFCCCTLPFNSYVEILYFTRESFRKRDDFEELVYYQLDQYCEVRMGNIQINHVSDSSLLFSFTKFLFQLSPHEYLVEGHHFQSQLQYYPFIIDTSEGDNKATIRQLELNFSHQPFNLKNIIIRENRLQYTAIDTHFIIQYQQQFWSPKLFYLLFVNKQTRAIQIFKKYKGEGFKISILSNGKSAEYVVLKQNSPQGYIVMSQWKIKVNEVFIQFLLHQNQDFNDDLLLDCYQLLKI